MQIKVIGVGCIEVESNIALDILKQLKLKDVIAVKVNDIIKDISTTDQLNETDTLEFITRDSQDGLKILRHSCAHITAMAVARVYNGAQFAIGPTIDNGYYYDMELPNGITISTESLAAIEAEMQKIIDASLPFTRQVVTKQKALELFANNKYKREIIEALPDTEVISIYYIGNEFFDLCRGPHISNTSVIKKGSYKLEGVSGSYWRGDSRDQKLQRIYGTAWSNKDVLAKYITMIEEAQKRDHRKLGAALDLFLLNDAAVGSVFWLKNGYTLFSKIRETIANLITKHGYFIVQTPMVLSQKLWETSGHWDKFQENMFIVSDNEEHQMAIKPMNCPGHVTIYQSGEVKSYRSLPYRMAEFGSCHRNEPSGALHGIMRLRQFTQDDGHVFCTPDQIISESIEICDIIKKLYSKFGFNDISIKFSTRPEKRAGSDEIWDKAEKALLDALGAAKLPYTINEGEGAFYGPKLEFILKDSLGRDWQCGTLQVDFVLPERFGLTYVDKDGSRKQPVMLHRALAGSLERFIAILIEHYGGALPFWLAPVQVTIATINNSVEGYAEGLKKRLEEVNIRVETDYSNEKISYKVNSSTSKKIPVMIAIGAKEAENNTVSVRWFGSMNTESVRLDEIINNLMKMNQ